MFSFIAGEKNGWGLVCSVDFYSYFVLPSQGPIQCRRGLVRANQHFWRFAGWLMRSVVEREHTAGIDC